MKINKENYEQYFVDFVENNLSATDKAAVLEFVKQNPKLKAELDLFAQAFVEPDTSIVYENKEELKHRESDRKVIFLFNWKFVSAAAAAVVLMVWFFQKPAGEDWQGKQAANTPVSVKDSSIHTAPVEQPKEIVPGLAQVKQPTETVNAPVQKIQRNPVAVQQKQQEVMPGQEYEQKQLPPAPGTIVNEQLATHGKDTSTIKPEAKDKLRQKLEKPLLADDKNLPAPVLPDSSMMAKNEQVPAAAEGQLSLKEKVTGQIESRLGNLLSYFTKPDFNVKRVKVNDRTRIVFNLENEKLHLMGSMRAGL